MEMGLVPVILSDGWVPPRGPHWPDFSVTVPERDVTQLVSILDGYGDRWSDMGTRDRETWLEWFSPPKQFNYIVDSCAEIMGSVKVSEARVRRAWPLLVASARARADFARLRVSVRATGSAALRHIRPGHGR
jgi:hypothetical protein